jgi:hypothetical protein
VIGRRAWWKQLAVTTQSKMIFKTAALTADQINKVLIGDD